MAQQTIASSGFEAKHINDVIASIQEDEELQGTVEVTPDPDRPNNYQLRFKEVHLTDLAKLGARYLWLIDPKLKARDDYETIEPVCDRVVEILLRYASSQVQAYERKRATQGNS